MPSSHFFYSHARPEWMMVGVVDRGTFQIYASNHLTELGFERNDESVRDWAGERLFTIPRIYLSGEMTSLTLVQGDDWAEAVQKLFEVWSPGGQGPNLGLPRPSYELHPSNSHSVVNPNAVCPKHSQTHYAHCDDCCPWRPR